MAVIVLTSAGGAPGVTTTAVGLTLGWPRSVVLVDADPSAPQAVLAGYLKGTSGTAKGLVRVAESHRERRPLEEAVLDQSLELSDDGVVRRLLLPGFQRPANSLLFAPVWPDLVRAFGRLGEHEIDVVVDAGRIPPRGLPQPLVESATALCLLTRTGLRSLAAARNVLPALVEQTRAGGAVAPQLLLVGPGRPYSRREVGAALDVAVLAELPDDPQTAAVFSDGAERSRQFDRSPLVRALHEVSELIGRRVRAADERVGAVA